MIELRAGGATDVGMVREVNEDQLLLASPLFAVADGMGGAAAGEVASALAVEALRAGFERVETKTPDSLVEAALAANRAVWDQSEADPSLRGMGTTLVALALVDGPKLAIVNVGDSRLYVLHGGDLHQVTYDHNLVAEMVAEGRISKEEAEFHPRRNIMTRALGVDPDVPIDLFEVDDLVPGDRYLLCSDGLPREMKDDQIAALLRRLADPEVAARELVAEAKRQGGNDNITVVVVDVVDPEAPVQPAAPDPGPVSDGATTVVPAVDAPAPEAAAAEASPPTARRRLFRRQRDQDRPVARRITFRVILFIAALLVILGGAAAAVGWYARSGYFVGLKGPDLVVFKGRPGGVLWFRPTVTQYTSVSTNDVEPRHLPELQAGQEEPSISAANQYIYSLLLEKQQADQALRPLPPRTTTTTRPRTTRTTTRAPTATTRP